MELWEIEAHVQIRNLVAAYNANGDSGRFDEMMRVFAPDGVLEAGGVRHEGHAGIRAFVSGVADGKPRALAAPGDAPEAGAGGSTTGRRRFIRHFTATHEITVLSPERATGYSYYQVLTQDGLDHWGRYFDEYVNLDGTWLIAHRRATTDAAIKGGWGAARTDQ